MSAQTKMIIITSNEDVIRQFISNKTPNTRVIDLDNDMQQASLERDNNNMLNFNLLGEMSKLSSTNDHLYKRALQSPQHNPAKAAKTLKESADFKCAICGDQAIGYNYDAPSCGSCKAFFRRNANKNIENIRCLKRQGQCSVTHETPRKCQKCRLKRCFAAGMRKDFILTQEEKQRKKQRLEENRTFTSRRLTTSQSTDAPPISNILSNSKSPSATSDEVDRLLMNTTEDNDHILFDENDDLNQMGDALLETLFVEDWITIESIRSSFLSIFKSGREYSSLPDASDRTSVLINWSYIAHQNGLCFITFCRQIAEFESLDADDRFVLIKYNLFPLYPILKCFYYNPAVYSGLNGDDEEAAKYRRLEALCRDPDGILEKFSTLTSSLVQWTEQDPAILSLLLTILMFSQGLSMNEDEPSLKNPLAVNQAQCYYTKVLWSYLSQKWGEVKSTSWFSELLNIIFRMQSLTKRLRAYFRAEFPTSDAVDKLAPLIQSALNIS